MAAELTCLAQDPVRLIVLIIAGWLFAAVVVSLAVGAICGLRR